MKKYSIMNTVKLTDKKKTRTIVLLIVFLALAVITALRIGWAAISFSDIFSMFLGTGCITGEARAIIMDVRLPRICIDIAVGMGLSVSGCAMQGIFRNPMASPFVTGIASGGAFGAALIIILGLPAALTGPSAFFFALVTAFFVYSLARTSSGIPVETLLLAGIAVSFFFSAMVAFIQYMADEKQLREIILWTMGRLWEADWTKVFIALPSITAGTAALTFYHHELNLIIIGDRTALNLGVEIHKVRAIILVLVSFITGMAVSVSGVIGFVGLIVPHVMRMMMGPDHRYLLPASALGGALFILICDTAARTVMSPIELPVGIITALCGVPFFLFILKNRKRLVGFSYGS